MQQLCMPTDSRVLIYLDQDRFEAAIFNLHNIGQFEALGKSSCLALGVARYR